MVRVFQASEKAQQEAVTSGRWAIVVSRYNPKVTHGLLQGAMETLRARGVAESDIDVFWVPGSFEIPTIAGHLARSGQYVAVLCLGAVIKGETTHDQHINRAVSLSLARLGTETGVPVLFGVLTCNTLEQALARSGPVTGTRGKDSEGSRIGNKGVECAEAALEMVALLREMKEAGVACYPRTSSSSPPIQRVSAQQSAGHQDKARNEVEGGNGGSGQHPGCSEDFTNPQESRPGATREDLKGNPLGSASTRAAGEDQPSIPTSVDEDLEPPKATSPRARAREAAFQILFHWDINPQFPLGEVDRFLRETLHNPAAVDFAQELIRGVTEMRDRLDEEIQSVAEHWAISRMSVTDRNVLRIGAYELMYTDTPSEVIIDQAVELAKRFGTSQSGAFVNGILDQLMRKIRGGDLGTREPSESKKRRDSGQSSPR